MSGGFADLGLLPELLQAIDDLGWQLPTDIQDEAIPLILGGGDVMGAAETGSGKTAAFALPIIQSVYERVQRGPTTTASPSPSTRKRSLSDNLKDIDIRLNKHDCDPDVQVSEDSFACSYGLSGQWQGIRASHGINQGCYYYECKVTSKGNCRVGWATMSAHLELGKDAYGFGYGGKGWKSNNGQFEKYGGEYSENDYIGVYINLEQGQIIYSKNGRMLDVAYEIPESLKGAVFFPAIALSGGSYEVNFGAKPFRHLPSSSTYKALVKADSSHIFDVDAMESYTISGNRKQPLAIIIEPTRDLAEQVFQSVTELSRHLKNPPLRSVLLIGDDKQNTKAVLQKGVDIVIGTIGKIVGSIESKQLDLSQIRFFVLDEADKLTAADNIASIKQIYGKCPGGGTGVHRLQVCFFSATLHAPQIRELAESICMNPTWIDLKGQETVMPDTLHHVVLPVLPQAHYNFIVPNKLQSQGLVLDEVHNREDLQGNGNSTAQNQFSQKVKEMKPFLAKQLIDKFQMSQVMIFCRTNLDCMNLEKFFLHQNSLPDNSKKGLEAKYTCKILGGMLSMEERRANLQLFKENEVRILICTDVAARGIDITGLPYVINMTLPDEAEDYVHRIGRVGRSDRMGLAISLVAMENDEKVWYHKCNKKGGIGCQNRQLVEKGGCTIWYHEQQCLQKIHAKIQSTILQMTPKLDKNSMEWNLPEEIAKLNITYGEIASDSILHKETKVYMTEHMIGEVRQLAELEMRAQNIFLSINQLLANTASSSSK